MADKFFSWINFNTVVVKISFWKILLSSESHARPTGLSCKFLAIHNGYVLTVRGITRYCICIGRSIQKGNITYWPRRCFNLDKVLQGAIMNISVGATSRSGREFSGMRGKCETSRYVGAYSTITNKKPINRRTANAKQWKIKVKIINL